MARGGKDATLANHRKSTGLSESTATGAKVVLPGHVSASRAGRSATGNARAHRGSRGAGLFVDARSVCVCVC